VSDAEQEERFQGRAHRSWKRWKLSPMDLFARTRWSAYEAARNSMLLRTDHSAAPWYVVPSDHKRAARLNCISRLLSKVPYEDMPPAPMKVPSKDNLPEHLAKPQRAPYKPPPHGTVVPSLYSSSALTTPTFCLGEPEDCASPYNGSEDSDDHEVLYEHAGDA